MFQNSLEYIKKTEKIPLGKLKFKLINIDDKNFSTCDENLLKFLYSRRLSVEQTFRLIENHLRYRRENPEIFTNLSINDPEIRSALENSLPGLLPQTDRKCRTIIVFHANNWDGQISLISIYRALILCLDFALQNVHVQNNGFVIIVNWEQFTFKKSTWINPKIIRHMIHGMQECYPVKILELHFIASPWYINTAFNVYKLSFEEDIRENFHVHGRNLSTLHEFIHRDVLPTELGGSLPSYNCAKLIDELESYCKNSVR
ncbi:clavesin-2-like [Coccinella septempunctata]|uniref:clavesin-2-like n=1 Tax=Coccinella septempunctata TaxID=41139 RepID=UPI001D09504E|nr:clavesin-2-like [Coccinella septempunctata]